MPGTRKLGRTTDHRKAMLRGMVTYLFENGKVETTVTRAKEVRAMAEKMITIAKDNSLHARRQVLAYVTKEDVVKNLFDVIAPRYADVNGGYTRITKTGARRGDAAEMCIIELVETKAELEAKAAAAKKAAKKPAAKKPAAKKSAPKAEKKEAETDNTAEAKE
jgi:large subunit ribosomal protein L17